MMAHTWAVTLADMTSIDPIWKSHSSRQPYSAFQNPVSLFIALFNIMILVYQSTWLFILAII